MLAESACGCTKSTVVWMCWYKVDDVDLNHDRLQEVLQLRNCGCDVCEWVEQLHDGGEWDDGVGGWAGGAGGDACGDKWELE